MASHARGYSLRKKSGAGDEGDGPAELSGEELFHHRLALALGRSVGELLKLPERELQRWWDFYQVDPWGSWRDNFHAAMITSELLNIQLKRQDRIEMGRFFYEDPRIAKHRKLANIHAFLESGARRSERGAKPKRASTRKRGGASTGPTKGK